MSYTESVSLGWFSRLRNSFANLGCGLLLLVAAFPLLWFNEGRAVREANGIAAARKAVISVSAEPIDKANDGKLVHVSGSVKLNGKLKDDFSGLQVEALRLRRKVEIYQWLEHQQSRTVKQAGGSERRETTYSYEQKWVSEPVSSKDFKERAQHENRGTLPCQGLTIDSAEARLGAFRLGPAVTHLDNFKAHPVAQDLAPPKGFRVQDQLLYRGQGGDSGQPQVGDVRVSFEAVQASELTVVAAQQGDSFAKFPAGSIQVMEVREGRVPAAEVFGDLERTNTALTWIGRLAGFFFLFVAVLILLKPLAVLADVIPFVGNLVEFGSALVALAIALPFTLATVAVAWFAYRPLLSISLLALGGGAFYLLKKRMKPPLQ